MQLIAKEGVYHVHKFYIIIKAEFQKSPKQVHYDWSSLSPYRRYTAMTEVQCGIMPKVEYGLTQTVLPYMKACNNTVLVKQNQSQAVYINIKIWCLPLPRTTNLLCLHYMAKMVQKSTLLVKHHKHLIICINHKVCYCITIPLHCL
jgi:hypothetical protein